MNKLKLIIRYGKVGKFLHFVAFWALIVAKYSFLTLNNLEYNADPFIWFTWLALFISFFYMS
ncbi:MAG: hypothetical protein OQK57_01950, partial [Ignavibacteriaceae bacterium]|nr:hypothetical protein [Ignavibacteriaceae bacterium]